MYGLEILRIRLSFGVIRGLENDSAWDLTFGDLRFLRITYFWFLKTSLRLTCRKIEKKIGCSLMVPKEQNFESKFRSLQCKGTSQQVNETKRAINSRLKKVALKKKDPNAHSIKCHIIDTKQILGGKYSDKNNNYDIIRNV